MRAFLKIEALMLALAFAAWPIVGIARGISPLTIEALKALGACFAISQVIGVGLLITFLTSDEEIRRELNS
jgi:hypothetical protein